jgi:hypothetical protein
MQIIVCDAAQVTQVVFLEIVAFFIHSVLTHFVNKIEISIEIFEKFSHISLLLPSSFRLVLAEGYKRVHPAIASVFLYHL